VQSALFGRLALAGMLLAVAVTAAQAQRSTGTAATREAPIDLPFQKFVLKNGLTLIVHEDHKAPIVAVNVWYHVGSKNEVPGRTGFAHLFEHLMFQGTEHYKGEYFTPFEQVGVTDQNGTTNNDRTNYFENVPTNALDVALWMESDRMGHLLGAIDQGRLDEQRGVVQNEKREGENEPYGKVWEFLTPRLFPANHPYSWTVIGSMDDLNAAKLEDVKAWFQTYYGAANAVVVIAGDITPEMARVKVEHYFGDIPSGPPVARQDAWIARRTGSQRGIMQDRVPQPRLYRVWNIPGWGTADGRYLDLAGDVLSSGKNSRLYKRLVYDDQIATSVAAYVDTREIGGLFVVEATARPGDDLTKVERAVDEELTRFLRTGPTPAEVARVKTQYRAGFVRGIERIGGFGGKSDVLAQGEVFGGRPDAYKTTLARVAAATPADLLGAGRRWLTDGDYTLEVHPFPQYLTAETGADRSQLPDAGTPPVATFPALERATLSNGLKVVLAQRPSIPQVRLDLVFDAGFAADQHGLPGTANMTFAMLDEGTTTRSSLQISETLQRLGANLGTFSRLDYSTVSLEALKEHLDPSLELFADVVLHPSFPSADFDRLKKQQLAAIRREKAEPVSVAFRALPALLYGPGHAYATPWTGTGTEESVSKMARAEVAAFQRTWLKPNHATLIVTGATTMAEIRPRLERLFANWKGGDIPVKNIGQVPLPSKPTVYLIDRPGALQSAVLAGNLAPPKNNPDEVAIEAMNTILGGEFGSRINLNLREDKHWAYGAYSFIRDARGQRPFVAYAPVQTDKTKEAIVEVARELRGIIKDRPVEPEELAKAKSALTLTLPGEWETMAAVGGTVRSIITFGLDDRYYDTYPAKVRALTLEQIPAAAGEVVHPDQLVWVIVGDRAKIEAGVRELNLGDVKVIEAS